MLKHRRHLYKSSAVDVALFMVTAFIFTLTEKDLLIFLQFAIEILLAWLRIESTTLDISSMTSQPWLPLFYHLGHAW